MNFETQSEAWLTNLATRKRRPAKPATLATFRAYMRAHIVPFLGNVEIEAFGNAEMRAFVAHLAAKSLAPKTILEISNAVRQIVASVVDANGDEVFPRKWNSEFIDAPMVEKQRQPTVTSSQIEEAISKASEADGILYVLLAASGLRIGEALSLRIGPCESSSYLDETAHAVTVRTSVWRRREQTPKTLSAFRTIELARPVAERVSSFVRNRSGFVFGNGIAPSESSFRDRLNKVLPDVGFHAFRRFRTTTVRAARCPEELIRYFLGHSDGSITDRYSKLSLDPEVRREWADRVGAGFQL